MLSEYFSLDRQKVWDSTGKLTQEGGPVESLFQFAIREGISLPNKIKESSLLTGLLSEAFEQANKNYH
jgi:hypothetical protein